MSNHPSVFHELQFAADYADNPPKFVPGYREIHRLAAVLISERAPEQARVLVLGAGGGLEIRALAEARPRWTFDGVDPAAPMLDLARTTLGPLTARVGLHEGYIDDAPAGPFDAATCFLALHFLPPDERRRTAAQVRRRLAPGAPFLVAHMSIPQHDEQDRAILQEAGFSDVTEFYSAFTFRGWVGYA